MTYNITTSQLTLMIILVVWELAWKAIALWRAARNNQPYWFGAILLINSAGILPIIYVLITEQREDILEQSEVGTPLAQGGNHAK